MNPVKAIVPAALMGCLVVFWVSSQLFTGGLATVQAAAITPIPEAKNAAAAAVQSDCQISQRYPKSILQWCSLIDQYGAEVSLASNLIAAVMLQESGGNPTAYSSSGAVGLLQVMPRDGLAAAFQCKNGPCFASRPTISELKDPEYNIAYGTRFLASLLKRDRPLWRLHHRLIALMFFIA